MALLVAASLLLILLAATLPQLALQPGTKFSLGEAATAIGGGSTEQGGGDLLLLAFRGAMLLALVALPFYIVLNLLTGEGRSRLVADLLAILILFLLLNLLPQNPAEPPPLEAEPGLWGPLALGDGDAGPADEFAPSLPPWLDELAALALAMLISGATAAILWWIRKRRQRLATRPGIQLAQKAQEAIDAMLAGEDIQDAVIRSYVQMSQVLQQERHIEREADMTPHEFEQLLAQQGFPAGPVHDLTRLFEQARYGNRLTGQREEQRAIASLRAIVDYCRELEAGR